MEIEDMSTETIKKYLEKKRRKNKHIIDVRSFEDDRGNKWNYNSLATADHVFRSIESYPLNTLVLFNDPGNTTVFFPEIDEIYCSNGYINPAMEKKWVSLTHNWETVNGEHHVNTFKNDRVKTTTGFEDFENAMEFAVSEAKRIGITLIRIDAPWAPNGELSIKKCV